MLESFLLICISSLFHLKTQTSMLLWMEQHYVPCFYSHFSFDMKTLAAHLEASHQDPVRGLFTQGHLIRG